MCAVPTWVDSWDVGWGQQCGVQGGVSDLCGVSDLVDLCGAWVEER